MELVPLLRQYASDITHLFYPHICVGCGTDIIDTKETLCAKCISDLPVTDFFRFANNPVEQLFAGRILIQQAGSAFYFTKQSVFQQIVFEIKYRGNREIGKFLGTQTALQLQQSGRFSDIDLIVPLPLNARRLQERGYNQASLMAYAMGDVLQKPVCETAVARKTNTETQTKKDRSHRWQNMQDMFEVKEPMKLENRHILLVDDIVTTGATLEACGAALLSVSGVRISIATAAYTI